jgi:hypothetical protein
MQPWERRGPAAGVPSPCQTPPTCEYSGRALWAYPLPVRAIYEYSECPLPVRDLCSGYADEEPQDPIVSCNCIMQLYHAIVSCSCIMQLYPACTRCKLSYTSCRCSACHTTAGSHINGVYPAGSPRERSLTEAR